MKAHLKTVYTEAQTTIDSETGEVIDVTTKEVKVLTDTREEFLQFYISLEAKIIEMSLSEERLLMYCIIHCDRNNVINIGSYAKKEINNKYKIASSTIANGLSQLMSKGVIVRVGRGAYKINPRYVWKGNSNDRRSSLKYFLEVECPNC
jgi:hypothetical protein